MTTGIPGTKRTKVGPGAGMFRSVPVPPVIANLPGDQWAFESESGCYVVVAHEPAREVPEGIWVPNEARMLWHMSISHPKRYPSWDEIADARYTLCPQDITMALLLPPPEEYVNAHPHVFHLWQIDDRRSAE